MLEFGRFEAMTFDCYGTLIDWEKGILHALKPILDVHGVTAEPEDSLLEAFGRHEAAIESGPYVKYHEVLAGCFVRLCGELGITPNEYEAREFAESIADWPPFDDSSAALNRLATRYKLGVITNCDKDLFALSNARLGVTFNWVVTAEQAKSYKPSPHNFEVAFATIGLPRERILHVAQSLFHDHVPAKRLGISTVWVDRRQGKSGSGATPPASVAPDMTFPDMKTFADAALG